MVVDPAKQVLIPRLPGSRSYHVRYLGKAGRSKRCCCLTMPPTKNTNKRKADDLDGLEIRGDQKPWIIPCGSQKQTKRPTPPDT